MRKMRSEKQSSIQAMSYTLLLLICLMLLSACAAPEPLEEPEPMPPTASEAEPHSCFTEHILPEEAESVLAVFFQRRAFGGRGSFELAKIIYQSADRIFLILKDIGSTEPAAHDAPRIFLAMEKTNTGQWNVADVVDQWDYAGHDSKPGWDAINSRVSELFPKYRTLAAQANVDTVMTLLEDDVVLSSCFPSTGSTPEMWEAVRDQIELIYDESQTADLVCREFFRVFGVESMDFTEPTFIVSLQKTEAFDSESHENVAFFFRENGGGNSIYIVVRVMTDGTFCMKADPWATASISSLRG